MTAGSVSAWYGSYRRSLPKTKSNVSSGRRLGVFFEAAVADRSAAEAAEGGSIRRLGLRRPLGLRRRLLAPIAPRHAGDAARYGEGFFTGASLSAFSLRLLISVLLLGVSRGSLQRLQQRFLEVGHAHLRRAELGGEEAAQADARAELQHALPSAPVRVLVDVVREHQRGVPQLRADAAAERQLANAHDAVAREGDVAEGLARARARARGQGELERGAERREGGLGTGGGVERRQRLLQRERRARLASLLGVRRVGGNLRRERARRALAATRAPPGVRERIQPIPDVLARREGGVPVALVRHRGVAHRESGEGAKTNAGTSEARATDRFQRVSRSSFVDRVRAGEVDNDDADLNEPNRTARPRAQTVARAFEPRTVPREPSPASAILRRCARPSVATARLDARDPPSTKRPRSTFFSSPSAPRSRIWRQISRRGGLPARAFDRAVAAAARRPERVPDVPTPGTPLATFADPAARVPLPSPHGHPLSQPSHHGACAPRPALARDARERRPRARLSGRPAADHAARPAPLPRPRTSPDLASPRGRRAGRAGPPTVASRPRARLVFRLQRPRRSKARGD